MKRWTASQIGSWALIVLTALALVGLLVAKYVYSVQIPDAVIGAVFSGLLSTAIAANCRAINPRVDGIIDGIPLSALPPSIRQTVSVMIAAYRAEEARQAAERAKASAAAALQSVPKAAEALAAPALAAVAPVVAAASSRDMDELKTILSGVSMQMERTADGLLRMSAPSGMPALAPSVPGDAISPPPMTDGSVSAEAPISPTNPGGSIAPPVQADAVSLTGGNQ